MNLYQMTTDFENYLNADTDEEIANALAEITSGQIEKKAEGYCHFIANLEGDIEKFKAQEKRLATIRRAMENKLAHVKDYMKTAMEDHGIQVIPAGTFKVSIQRNPPALVETNREICPPRFRVIIPEAWEPDKARIKEALKNGEVVYGYELTTGTSLRIR